MRDVVVVVGELQVFVVVNVFAVVVVDAASKPLARDTAFSGMVLMVVVVVHSEFFGQSA